MFVDRGLDAVALAIAASPVDDRHERAGSELDARVAEICGALNRLFGELVDQVAEALRANLWQVDGIRSPAHWVQWRTGLSAVHAAELVRVARRADGLPACTEALREGVMSLDQLDAVARTVPDPYDGDVVDIARSSTVSQLNRVLSRMSFVDRDEHADAAGDGGTDVEGAVPGEVRTSTDRE